MNVVSGAFNEMLALRSIESKATIKGKYVSRNSTRLNWLYALLAIGMLALYGFAIEPYWIDTRIHQIEGAANSVRIIQLSDLHLQKIGRREYAALDEIERLNPDLIIFSGDVLDGPMTNLLLGQFLSKLPKAYKVATLGNWEYWGNVDLNNLKEIYATHDVALLSNAEIVLSIKGRQFRIVGLDDATAGTPKLNGLGYRHLPETSLLIQHSPAFFDSASAKRAASDGKFDVCLSGHTHAGQITLFGWPIWLPPGSGAYVHGWYETPLCKLYVSKGLGTSLLPVRLFARPEIAVFDF